MSAARDAVLGRIRRGLGRTGPVDDSRRAELESRLKNHERGIIPDRSKRDPKALVDLFVEMAEKVQTSVARVAAPADVPDALGE